ncbi:hypothetical protein LN893_11550 [Pontibacter sp. XAAS-A31]|nr:hypothetical protein [Pontibacter harenae]
MVYGADSIEALYDEEKRINFIKCHTSFNSNEFREGLMQAYRFALEHKVKQWLLDLRDIGELNEEDNTWIQLHLFPMMMMTLGPSNYMAIVCSKSCYKNLLKAVGKLGLKTYNSFVILNTFCDLEKAEHWLGKKLAK